MQTSTLISLTGSFLRLVGEAVADVKRQDLAKLDADQLRIKRQLLSEKLEEFKVNLDTAVKKEQGKAEQDLISRGLGNLTVRESALKAIEHDAATELEKASREYNRGIEEIALLEGRLEVQNRPPWWKKLLRTLAFLENDLQASSEPNRRCSRSRPRPGFPEFKRLSSPALRSCVVLRKRSATPVHRCATTHSTPC
jgi:hypothetical protein